MSINELFNQLNSPGQNNVSLGELCLRLSIASLIGFYITFISYITSTNGIGQKKVYQAQVLLTVVCALIINIIGFNIAWAIGLTGTLSFIRFRTTLRDPKDTAIFFYSIALGIASGAGEFVLCVLGGSVFTLILGIFRWIPFFRKEPYMLKVVGQDITDDTFYKSYFTQNHIDFRFSDLSRKKKQIKYKIFIYKKELFLILDKFHSELGEKFIELEKEDEENPI